MCLFVRNINIDCDSLSLQCRDGEQTRVGDTHGEHIVLTSERSGRETYWRQVQSSGLTDYSERWHALDMEPSTDRWTQLKGIYDGCCLDVKEESIDQMALVVERCQYIKSGNENVEIENSIGSLWQSFYFVSLPHWEREQQGAKKRENDGFFFHQLYTGSRLAWKIVSKRRRWCPTLELFNRVYRSAGRAWNENLYSDSLLLENELSVVFSVKVWLRSS